MIGIILGWNCKHHRGTSPQLQTNDLAIGSYSTRQSPTNTSLTPPLPNTHSSEPNENRFTYNLSVELESQDEGRSEYICPETAPSNEQ